MSASIAGNVSVQSLEGAASSVTVSLSGLVSDVRPNGYDLASVWLDPTSATTILGSAGSAAVVLAPTSSVSAADIPNESSSRRRRLPDQGRCP